jgi:hypothetical protein
MADFFGWFTAEHIAALAATIAAVLLAAEKIVTLTPTKADDELLAKIEAVIGKILPSTPPKA